jgi:hypothetical protein
VSDAVAFIVVEGMPDGTGELHSLHWKRDKKEVLHREYILELISKSWTKSK